MGKDITKQVRMKRGTQTFTRENYTTKYYYDLQWWKVNPETFYTLQELREVIFPQDPYTEEKFSPPGFNINLSTLTRFTANLPFDYKEMVYPNSGVKGVRKIKIYQGKDILKEVDRRDAIYDARTQKKFRLSEF